MKSLGQVTLLVGVRSQRSLEPQPSRLTTVLPHGGTVLRARGFGLANHSLIHLLFSIPRDTALG